MSKENKAEAAAPEQVKKRHGDRRDAYLIRDADSMHVLQGYLLPNRADNEALAIVDLDVTKALEYLDRKNAQEPKYKYTLFHFIDAAIALTVHNRPKMNRYYCGNRYYQRRDITFSFVARRQFDDHSEEALCVMTADRGGEEGICDQFHRKITEFVHTVRSEKQKDGTTEQMDFVTKVPRFIFKLAMKFIMFMDNHDLMPKAFFNVNPYYSTVFITNLGSIKLSAQYHHLANFGTNSFFVTVSEKKLRPVFAPDGSYEMRPMLDLGLTIDERIADGYYFGKTIKLVRYIFDHPEVLDRPLGEPIAEEEYIGY